MVTITAAELQKQFGRYRDLALREPVSVTHHGRDSVVLLSAAEYRRLRQFEIKEDELTEERKNEIRTTMEAHRKTVEKLAR